MAGPANGYGTAVMDANDVTLFTVESVPVSEYLSAVGAWAIDADLTVAEGKALDGIRDAAAALGGDTVVGMRVATEKELTIGSSNPLFTNDVDVFSTGVYRVHVTGTAARR